MTKKIFGIVNWNHYLLFLAYLYTLSLAVVFVTWEATPYNPGYAFIQSVEVFFILLVSFGLCEYPVKRFIKKRSLRILSGLLGLFIVSVLIIRLHIEITAYNIQFVLYHSLKVFFTMAVIGLLTRVIIGNYRFRH